MKKLMLVLAIVSVLVISLTACSAGLAETPPAQETAAPTEVVTAAPTEPSTITTEVATEVATAVPTAEATAVPTDAPVTCDTPSIKVSLDGLAWTEMGLYLKTELGERMTYTSRSFLVPEKEWNVALTSGELKTVETTWQFVKICVPDTTFARIFAGGYEQKLVHHDDGVIMTLEPGSYEFKIRNGEIVLWYPNQTDFATKDLTRIIEQIKSGNFDIDGELALFGVTTDLLPQIPQDLVKDKDIQIIPDAVVISQ